MAVHNELHLLIDQLSEADDQATLEYARWLLSQNQPAHPELDALIAHRGTLSFSDLTRLAAHPIMPLELEASANQPGQEAQ